MTTLSWDRVGEVLNQRTPDPFASGGHLTLAFPVEEYKGWCQETGTYIVRMARTGKL